MQKVCCAPKCWLPYARILCCNAVWFLHYLSYKETRLDQMPWGNPCSWLRCDLWLLGRFVSEKRRFVLQVSHGGMIMQDLCVQMAEFLCCSFCLKRAGLCDYYFVVAERDFSCWATTPRVDHTRQESYPSYAKQGSLLTRIMSQGCGIATQREVGPLKQGSRWGQQKWSQV